MMWLLLIIILFIISLKIKQNRLCEQNKELNRKINSLADDCKNNRDKITNLLTYLLGRSPSRFSPETIITMGLGENGALNNLQDSISKKANIGIADILQKGISNCNDSIVSLEKYFGIEYVEINKPQPNIYFSGYKKVSKKK